MQCEHVQELILTDYIDGQLTLEKSKAVEAHIGTCSKCQELVAALRPISEKSFLEPKQNPVSQKRVWQNIKSQIETQKAQPVSTNPFEGIAAWLRNLVYMPKPAFALAAFVLAFFVVVIQPRFNARQDISAAIESEYYFDDDLLASQKAEDQGYETAIEDFFL